MIVATKKSRINILLRFIIYSRQLCIYISISLYNIYMKCKDEMDIRDVTREIEDLVENHMNVVNDSVG